MYDVESSEESWKKTIITRNYLIITVIKSSLTLLLLLTFGNWNYL
jgi:hypothetical protein